MTGIRPGTPAYEQGLTSGHRRFMSGLLAHHNSTEYAAAMSTVMWHGGMDCAAAGYRPDDDAQGAADFFAGFLQAVRDAQAAGRGR